MPTHFSRSAVQEFFEYKVGCGAPDAFPDYASQLSELKLSLDDSNDLADRIRSDIQGQFERSALTLCQALKDLDGGSRMWPVVKLYYSVFYALRVELHLNGLSIVRCRKIFTTDGKRGSELIRFNNRTEKGDHGVAIALAARHLKDEDILQGASIEGTNVYWWLKSLRDIVQYKMKWPPESVGYDPFFPANQMDITSQVSMFLADHDPYFCFDPDYAALAIPIKRFQITAANVKSAGISLQAEFSSLVDGLTRATDSAKLLRPFFW